MNSVANVGRAAPRNLLLRAGILFVMAAAVWLSLAVFDIGFRASNDQRRDFDYALSHGPTEILSSDISGARAQGRVGHLIVFPLLSFGELIGDLFFIPALYVGMLVGMAWTVGRWGELLTGGRMALPLVALFIAALPLGLNHWLPNAYPPQFLPLAAALLAHVAWLSMARPRLWLVLVLLAPATFIGALAFELYLSLLAAMTLVEFGIYLFARRRAIAPGLTGRYLLWQLGLLALALGIYIGFRLRHPSTYEGNQPAAFSEFGRALQTAAMHLVDAPSFTTILQRMSEVPLDPRSLAAAFVIAVGLGLLATMAKLPGRLWGLLLALAGMSFMAASVLPLAIVGKYIRWCLDERHCAYLDNRFALMGMLLVVAGALLLVLGPRWARVALIVIVTTLGPITYLANLAERPYIDDLKIAEDRAKHFVCTNPDAADPLPIAEELAEMPDLTFYQEVDKTAYWTRYVAHLRGLRPWWFCP